MPSPRQIARNVRLLLQSAVQHAVDDPALLVVQASRRLPFAVRVGAGRALRAVAKALPGGQGAAALGAYMAGDIAGATELITRTTDSRSRMSGEVAVLLQRTDLLSPSAAPETRARAAWAHGDLSGAIAVLEGAGKGGSRYARRLRSELQLLTPGYSLPTPRPVQSTSPPREDSPLKVLHILTNSLPHTQSGYSLRTHRILTALRDQGIESVAITRTGYPVMIGKPLSADEDLVDGIRYVRTLPSRLPQTQEERLMAEVERALELVEEFRPHVIHATTNYYNALVAQAVSAATGLPWILEVRGLMEKTWIASRSSDRARQEATTSQKARLVSAREAQLASAAQTVVTLSSTMVEELVQRGVDVDSITVIPNGVDAALFDDHVNSDRARELVGLDRRAGFGEGAIVVGAVSALVDYEGFDVLLRAVAEVVDDSQAPGDLREGLRVVLAGEGVSRPGLLALAKELGIGDRVALPGRVARDSARRWVEALDLVVVPRKDLEVTRTVTPQKPVEALALGKPLIVSDLPALREVVTAPGGRTAAICVPPDDPHALATAIVGWFFEQNGRCQRNEPGTALASDRSWSEHSGRYRGLYEGMTRRSMGGAHGR